MSHTACIAFAPVRTLERANDPAWEGRTTYYRDSLRFLPNQDTIPLLLDHDPALEVGRVTDVWPMSWEDGEWLCAHATVTDPACLRAGMGASFGSIHAGTHADGQRVSLAYLKEITVCMRTRPVEPAARLVTLAPESTAARTRSPTRRSSSDPAAGGTIIHTPERLLIRPNSGVVLGVR